MALKRGRSVSPSSETNIYKSSNIEHGKCNFIGVYSPSLSAKALQQLPEFRTATHRIAAWRKPSRQKSLMPSSKVLYDLGHDDDGERWAGGRVQNVLNETQTEGTVVVARWYGGENIGPIRFTHMENCAREAIWKYKTASSQAATLKKQKLEQDSKRKQEETKRTELVKNLEERDNNIFTLRKLLAEKKAKLQDEEIVPPTPQKPQDYTKMSFEALQRVDKARDKTISFVLSQIDKVEEEMKLVEALEDGLGDGKEESESKQDKGKGKLVGPSTPPRNGS